VNEIIPLIKIIGQMILCTAGEKVGIAFSREKMLVVLLFLFHDWLGTQQFSSALANNSRQEECSST